MAAAAETSSSDPPRPDLHRRKRRLVLDRRYGWIFDEWTDPAVSALSGGRGMFCILPMAQALMNAAASSLPTNFQKLLAVHRHFKKFGINAIILPLQIPRLTMQQMQLAQLLNALNVSPH